METTLLFVKPDGVQRRLVGRILSRLEDRGLQNRRTEDAHDPP